jgi:hypothetical protein
LVLIDGTDFNAVVGKPYNRTIGAHNKSNVLLLSSWVVPAFQLLKSRVDEKIINQPLTAIAAVSLPPSSEPPTSGTNNDTAVSEATAAMTQVTLQAK